MSVVKAQNDELEKLAGNDSLRRIDSMHETLVAPDTAPNGLLASGLWRAAAAEPSLASKVGWEGGISPGISPGCLRSGVGELRPKGPSEILGTGEVH